MVQVGTHRRVSPHNVSGMKFLKEGKAGKIGMVRAFVHYGGGAGNGRSRRGCSRRAGLGFLVRSGAACGRSIRKIHPKGFRKFLDYANGTLGDWGIHWLDQILWWTEEKYPKTVYSTVAGPFAATTRTLPTRRWRTLSSSRSPPLGNIAAMRHNCREAQYRSLLLRHRRNVPHGMARWLDVLSRSNDRKPILHEDPQLHDPDGQNIPELWDDFIRLYQVGRRLSVTSRSDTGRQP